MTNKSQYTDEKIKTFIKKGGRSNAKSDFFRILKKSTSVLDRKR